MRDSVALFPDPTELSVASSMGSDGKLGKGLGTRLGVKDM